MDGSEPKARIQMPWPRMTDCGISNCSSDWVKSRPKSGVMPSVSKKLAVTMLTRTCCGAIAREIGWARVVVHRGEAVEGLIGGAVVEEVGWGDVGEIAEREFSVEPDEAIGVCEGERAEDDGVDDAEDGRVGADAEGESEDGDESEAGIFAEGAEGVAEILGEIVEERRRLRRWSRAVCWISGMLPSSR